LIIAWGQLEELFVWIKSKRKERKINNGFLIDAGLNQKEKMIKASQTRNA
jgi:hypothetical protein